MITTRLTRLAILTALACVLRIAFGAFPNVKPITALFFVLILAYGLADAIIVSTLTMIATGFLMGFFGDHLGTNHQLCLDIKPWGYDL